MLINIVYCIETTDTSCDQGYCVCTCIVTSVVIVIVCSISTKMYTYVLHYVVMCTHVHTMLVCVCATIFCESFSNVWTSSIFMPNPIHTLACKVLLRLLLIYWEVQMEKQLTEKVWHKNIYFKCNVNIFCVKLSQQFMNIVCCLVFWCLLFFIRFSPPWVIILSKSSVYI